MSDLVIAFCGSLAMQVPKYVDLPQGIRSANERQTGQALTDRRGRFAEFKRREFVDNLSVCQNDQVPYTLNGEAMAITDRNLTSVELRTLLERLALRDTWQRLSRTGALKYWSGRGWETTLSLATNQLNQLMEERNRIAHSAGATAIGYGDILSYLRFMRALGRALVTVLSSHLATM